ncbi:hypothetical protein [Sinorhizobium meliloti]|uniref:hypothetical protein n=1 Tax=Rhizobium meliloti TaxID=382 RepID=UPI000484C6F7|nr:hypothetical protein [Sinorhizobium meliloti]
MNRFALGKAQRRIERATVRYNKLVSASDHPEIVDLWDEFLHDLQAIFNAVGNAAGTNGKSQAWFARKKQERKNDELLQYLHQARHAAEHGIAPIASRMPGLMTIKTPDGVPLFVIPELILDPDFEKNTNLKVAHALPQVVLTVVQNKGVLYKPPTVHLGVSLADRSIANVAWLGLSYHARMVAEAETMVT